MQLPRFEPHARLRPISLLSTSQVRAHGSGSSTPCPRPAPYAAAVATGVGERLVLSWRSGEDLLEAVYAEGRVLLRVTSAGRTSEHRSRRFSRLTTPVTDVALTLTGTHLTVLTRGAGQDWVARSRVDLSGPARTGAAPAIDTRDAAWLGALEVGHEGAVEMLEAGGFGQLGLRDLRLASHADGTAYRLADGRPVLTATSAGPGFFDTAHTSVWALDPAGPALEHLSDLYFHRPDGDERPGVFGDHATHLVRDGDADAWLVATSTWGDFDARRRGAGVAVTLARTRVDLLEGEHVLDTEPLVLPTDGFRSVGVWDPHLVRTGDGWLVGYVSARRFFRFHPVLAAGPSLDRLGLRGVDPRRRATEGTTLWHRDGTWLVLASDGRDGRTGQRERYPVFDLDLHEIGALPAPYPTNIPWPTLVPASAEGEELVLVGFDGTRTGGSLLGYGTHGDVVIARSLSD
ncbi:hypothetical protein P5P86_20020 [Nocardioides sp. BP30]|uniref:hypothetical protein n=1 Tax=Nocardioides sp. BP30 TaxID=3036374 RepID=UPI00246886F0|nr:hypothetical protein [Nocardioides sp. BP30]WGL52224.1 hypothetical protein P5P86_20020 [Nocardioides sp. BP30]